MTKKKVKEALPDKNLKTAAASREDKPNTHAVPPVALFALGAAMEEGEKKYGLYNWRATNATASVFFDAIQRHIWAWWNGKDTTEDSGGRVSHLGAVMASCAILLDAEQCGVLNDDRNKVMPADVSRAWLNSASDSHGK